MKADEIRSGKPAPSDNLPTLQETPLKYQVVSAPEEMEEMGGDRGYIYALGLKIYESLPPHMRTDEMADKLGKQAGWALGAARYWAIKSAISRFLGGPK